MANYVTALAFSSTAGGRSILAVARNSGHVTLWSLFAQKGRFGLPHPWAACAVAWRPTVNERQMPGRSEPVSCEELLVGDDAGCLHYYSVHWPDFAAGHVSLIVKLEAHSQNICGLAWSPDGKTFVSGGNDNAALLFEVDAVTKPIPEGVAISNTKDDDQCSSAVATLTDTGLLTPPQSPERQPPLFAAPYIAGRHDSGLLAQFGILETAVIESSASTLDTLTPQGSPSEASLMGRPPLRAGRLQQTVSPAGKPKLANLDNLLIDPGVSGRHLTHKKSFYHSAAVKAIAYAPWQPTLLATGGGSNDRQIHFHHTESGSTLAVINVFAQVTSLAWSCTRREIVATFGYAQPEHDIRIAVFAWPSCKCVVSIPWERKANGEIGRALWAIPYPGGPNDAASDIKEDTDVGFQAWEAIRAREQARQREAERTASQRMASTEASNSQWSPLSARHARVRRRSKLEERTRGEGETWASRTEEEGSLIIACCDQTVKFFEVWAGKSKGRSRGIGAKAGVLGGSKVLEGWCQGVSVDEVEETDSIR